MNRLISEAWRRMVPGRIVLLTMVMLGVSFGLLLFVVSEGDSDLPPYQPQTAAEHFCGILLAIICWPVMAAHWAFGRVPGILGLPLALFGIALWPILIELLLAMKHVPRT